VGLDRIRNSRGGSPHRRDRLVVAETLRPCEDEDAGAWRPAGRISRTGVSIKSPS
jgi:hypothetical protein